MRRVGLTLIALLLLMPPARAAAVTFPQGVASGDVTHTSAVLWTRADGVADLEVEVAADVLFGDVKVRRRARATAAQDFTVKVTAGGLHPATVYYYRFHAGPAVSEVGTFTTAPVPGKPASLRFAFTGDSDGTLVGGAPFFNDFEVLDRVRGESPEFFVYLGDTIYGDSTLRAGGPAVTLAEYRDAYKTNRDYPALTSLLKSTSTVALWDDHEVLDDYAGQTVDPQRYAAGTRAFLEYMPVRDLRLHDPECAGNPRFRTFSWGKDADFIALDERSCRSASAVSACLLPPGIPFPVAFDLAPTLPGPLRAQLGAFFPAPPSTACLAALADPHRTFLGRVQKKRLKTALQASTARFKFVLNPVAIALRYVVPYDRWEGYAAERREILEFIRDHAIQNVIFLTTDEHANHVAPVVIASPAEPPVAWEFVTGPIATFTSQEQIAATVGPGLAGPATAAVLFIMKNVAGFECVNLNTYSYGVVDLDTVMGQARVTLKDDHGEPVVDQINPGIQCTKTLP